MGYPPGGRVSPRLDGRHPWNGLEVRDEVAALLSHAATVRHLHYIVRNINIQMNLRRQKEGIALEI